MSELKVGDQFKVVVDGTCFDKGSIIEYTDYKKNIGMMFKLVSGKCSWNNYKGSPGAFYDVYARHTVKIESTTINTKDLYSNVMGQGIVCGDTHISRCIRKKNNEEHYTIYYKDDQFMAKGCVKHSDIPALVAALLDIYDGNVKEEELPF